MPRGTRILRWLKKGVVLIYLLGVTSASVAQQNSIQDAEALDQQAGRLYGQGRYKEAIPLVREALAILEKALGPDHPDRLKSLDHLAMLYQDSGTYEEAEPLYKQALAIREKALGPEHLDTSVSVNHLARLYHDTGAYGQAEPLYKRALAIREKVLGAEYPGTAMSLSNLAGLYIDTGAYRQAEPLLERALAIREKVLGPEHPDTAYSLSNLGLLYWNTGDNGQAELLYKRALAIMEKALGPEHLVTARSLNNLAVLYEETGRFEQAEPLLERALAIREKALGPEHLDTARSLNNLAVLYWVTGAYGQAEALLKRALAIQEKVLGPQHQDTARSLDILATLYWATGDLARTGPLYRKAQAIHEKTLATFLLTGSESRKQAYLAQLSGQTFMRVSLSLTTPDHQAKVFGLRSVLMVKGRVLDVISDSAGRLRRNAKPEDRGLFEQLSEVAQKLSTLTHQALGNLQPEAYRQELQDLMTRQEQLEADLSKRSAEFRQQIAPIALAATQTAIPQKTALVEWYCYKPFDPNAKDAQSRLGKPRYVAYVLKRIGEPAVMDFGDAEALDQLIKDFRTGLGDPTNTYVQELAKELYDKLLRPLQHHLSNIDHLLISPDGALNLVPFAALLDETGAYLGSKKGITYVTSGRDLVRYGTPSLGKGDAIIVADPNYGEVAGEVAKVEPSNHMKRSVDLDRGAMSFTSLPGTAEEAKTLKTLLKVPDDHVLTQAKATEERFKQLHGPRILHVATHGFFLKDREVSNAALRRNFIQDIAPVPLGENPLLRSGLALAGANQRRSGEKDDGILTAAEVAQMDLRGTQLVVLSACETGVGDVQNGEGVYGLRRALVLAGAESQVTSLWKVADDATKDLMVDYYQRLLKGEGRSEALRNAQLSMMKDRSHPYYWAAFVPIGNWTPLAKSR